MVLLLKTTNQLKKLGALSWYRKLELIKAAHFLIISPITLTSKILNHLDGFILNLLRLANFLRQTQLFILAF